MNEPWIAYFLVFVLTVVAAYLLQIGLRGILEVRRQTRRRREGLSDWSMEEDTKVLHRRTSRLGESPFTAWPGTLILQSGTRLSSKKLCALALLLAVFVYLALPSASNAALRLSVSALGGIGLVVIFLRFQQARRLRQFGEQLPEVMDVIVRSLRAGHPLPVSLGLVAREMPSPAGPEFALVVDEVNYGRSIDEALENLYRRVGYPELRFFVASTAIAHQTGGNLGEILSRLSRMLRDRFRLSRKVRALSAEGRFSGYALTLLPVALFGLIHLVSPSYYADFWRDPVSTRVLAVSLGLLLIGNYAIYRLVNFKV